MTIYSLQIDHIDINRKLDKITKFVSNVSFIRVANMWFVITKQSNHDIICNALVLRT